MDWKQLPVLVTGGASFIGSHLVEALISRDANVTVVDDLSSGRLANIQSHVESGRVRFINVDLFDQRATNSSMADQSCVFHLAAVHGGRGFIESQEAACARNLLLDGLVFDACVRNRVEKIVYASTGCVYPRNLQADPSRIVKLSEDMVGAPYDADGMYGWAKLMGEMTLATLASEGKLKTVSCRYFTAYGPRASESHAIMAMIGRAFMKQNPFEVWGTGQQIRNWTYISDIVEGTIRAAETVDSGDAVNVGTTEATRVIDAAASIIALAGIETRIVTRPEMPTGPYYRIANDTKLARLSGWRPSTRFQEGLKMTFDWYFASKRESDVRNSVENLLFER